MPLGPGKQISGFSRSLMVRAARFLQERFPRSGKTGQLRLSPFFSEVFPAPLSTPHTLLTQSNPLEISTFGEQCRGVCGGGQGQLGAGGIAPRNWAAKCRAGSSAGAGAARGPRSRQPGLDTEPRPGRPQRVGRGLAGFPTASRLPSGSFLLFLCPCSSKRLVTLARGLSPAFLRFGGKRTDFLQFQNLRNPAKSRGGPGPDYYLKNYEDGEKLASHSRGVGEVWGVGAAVGVCV